jgi:hypothetical protein
MQVWEKPIADTEIGSAAESILGDTKITHPPADRLSTPWPLGGSSNALAKRSNRLSSGSAENPGDFPGVTGGRCVIRCVL